MPPATTIRARFREIGVLPASGRWPFSLGTLDHRQAARGTPKMLVQDACPSRVFAPLAAVEAGQLNAPWVLTGRTQYGLHLATQEIGHPPFRVVEGSRSCRDRAGNSPGGSGFVETPENGA